MVALYDQLTRLDASPIVALNRAVAVAELDGPKVALALVDAAARGLPRVARRPRRHAPQARPNRRREGVDDAAIATTHNSAERAYLGRKRGELV